MSEHHTIPSPLAGEGQGGGSVVSPPTARLRLACSPARGERSITLKQKLRRKSQALGFDIFRVARPEALIKEQENLGAYLAANYHAGMGWMETRASVRANPQLLWPEVRSILLLGMNYAPDVNPLEHLKARSHGLISVYAQGVDYHDVIKPRLKEIARELGAGNNAQAKVFVDTAPVMEKPLAQAAGMGWQGKHTVLVSREFGSWLFLGAIFTDIDLEPDASESDHCGSCRRCLDICPTGAFPKPYQLDSRKCISYLTIEHKGHIPRDLRRFFGNRIFGCDDCLAVCPWNKFAKAAHEQKLMSRRDIGLMPLAELLQLDDAAFRTLFAKTPVKRTGRDRFIRNCLIAAGNSGDMSLVKYVRALLGDESALVRVAAIWALAQLSQEEFQNEKSRAAQEQDSEVRAEWAAV
jgi:epoxyqueuosine reductase